MRYKLKALPTGDEGAATPATRAMTDLEAQGIASRIVRLYDMVVRRYAIEELERPGGQ